MTSFLFHISHSTHSMLDSAKTLILCKSYSYVIAVYDRYGNGAGVDQSSGCTEDLIRISKRIYVATLYCACAMLLYTTTLKTCGDGVERTEYHPNTSKCLFFAYS